MRQFAGHTLWLGHAGDLRDARAVSAAGVEAVIELADSEPFAALPRELVRLRFPLSDGGENPAWLVRLAAESTASLLRAGVPTLVCCAAGLSRSVCIAAAGIALAESRALADVLKEAAAFGPADVSPGLFEQIRHALGEGSVRSASGLGEGNDRDPAGEEMLDTLSRIFQEGGRLVCVSCARLGDRGEDHAFVTAVCLSFEHLSAVFRAVPEDDTLATALGPLNAEASEAIVGVDDETPWSSCLGRGLRWGWRLTNQQGYTDGVRLEFAEADDVRSTVVELLTIASALRVSVSSPQHRAEFGTASESSDRP